MSRHILAAEYSANVAGFELEMSIQAESEIVVVFGPSGAGKSLNLRILAGLLRPKTGLIQLRDRTLFDSRAQIDLAPQLRRVGYVPQQYALFPHRTIAQNIEYGLHQLPKAHRERRVGELLKIMDLEPQADKRPSQASGGEQQRTALARALAIRPEILLMDEPFSALDEILRTALREELQRLQARYSIPVILVTHNLSEAYTLADQLVVYDHGKVVQAGKRDEVFRHPNSPSIARLMGMVNILEVRVDRHQGENTLVDWDGKKLLVTGSPELSRGEQIRLGIRPEEVMIVRRTKSPATEATENLLRGVIVDDRAQGFDHLLTFSIDPEKDQTHSIFVRIPHPIYLRLNLSVGEPRSLSIQPSSIHIFPNEDG